LRRVAPALEFGRWATAEFGMGSVGQGGSVGPPENSSCVFGFLAPNRALRCTENPRVDGSIPSLATISNPMIRNGFRASPADHPWPSIVDPRTALTS